MPLRQVAIVLTTALVVSSSSPVLGMQEQERILPAQLLEGGKVHLVNDLQAWSDAMLVFRQFRRDFRQIDRFEAVGDRQEADLVCMLSADPGVIEQQAIVNRGIPYPSGFVSSKVMFLVIFDAKTNNLLYFDAVDWDTALAQTKTPSYTKLVQRLKATLDEAG
jgi:hypothetical protein